MVVSKTIEYTDEAWMKEGACYGRTDLVTSFFPVDGEQEQKQRRWKRRKVMAMCSECPVASSCSAYAERHNLSGIWAGKLYGPETRLRNRKKAAA